MSLLYRERDVGREGERKGGRETGGDGGRVIEKVKKSATRGQERRV